MKNVSFPLTEEVQNENEIELKKNYARVGNKNKRTGVTTHLYIHSFRCICICEWAIELGCFYKSKKSKGDGGHGCRWRKVLWITFILWLVMQMWMVGVKYSDKYRDCHVSVVVVI